MEQHKLLVASLLCFRLLIKKGTIDEAEVMALIKKEVSDEPPPQSESLKFIPESAWAAIKGLETVKKFKNICSEMGEEALTWRKWYGEEKAEIAELPKLYKDISTF